MRLNALEAIELIIKEKVDVENHLKKEARYAPIKQTVPTVWGKCKSIYKWLSHHYIQRRSVVFIVDSQFDSVFYREKVMKYVKNFFGNQLNDKDYFGFISLEDSEQACLDEIIIERRSANKKMKMRLLKKIAKR